MLSQEQKARLGCFGTQHILRPVFNQLLRYDLMQVQIQIFEAEQSGRFHDVFHNAGSYWQCEVLFLSVYHGQQRSPICWQRSHASHGAPLGIADEPAALVTAMAVVCLSNLLLGLVGYR
jgi:hypothetical protein